MKGSIYMILSDKTILKRTTNLINKDQNISNNEYNEDTRLGESEIVIAGRHRSFLVCLFGRLPPKFLF